MDEKKEKLNQQLEDIFDSSFSANSAWKKIQNLAKKGEVSKEELYLTLLENIVDDLLENHENVKNFLNQIGWPMEHESKEDNS
jgi:molecular chaperone GrpE (heat shock protein)